MRLIEVTQLRDAEQQKAVIKIIDENTKNINTLQEKCQNIGVDSFEKTKWDQVQRDLPAYRKARSDILALAEAGKQKRHLSFMKRVDLYLQVYRQAVRS